MRTVIEKNVLRYAHSDREKRFQEYHERDTMTPII